MSFPTRRAALGRLGWGAAVCWMPSFGRLRAHRLHDGDLFPLAESLRTASSERSFELAATALKQGVTPEALLGAVFLAGIFEIRPGPVGNELHAVMMVESVAQIAQRVPTAQAHLAVFQNLDEFKRSQAAGNRGGNWLLPMRTETAYRDEAAARKEFLAAMEAWETNRADRAMVALASFHDRRSLFEILWPYVGRSMVDIGHKVIFGAHVERMIGRIGWSHAEVALRSLSRGLVHYNSRGTASEAYPHSLELCAEFPEDWLQGKEDPEKSIELLRRLRKDNSHQAPHTVLAAIQEGLGPKTVWDGLRLYAAELFLRRSTSNPNAGAAILPVHAVTETNAFGYIYRATRLESTKRLMLLQAAAWLADMQATLKRRVNFSMRGSGFDAFEGDQESPALDLDEVIESGSPERVHAFLSADARRLPEFMQRQRHWVVRKARESHQFKYAAALHEEVAQAHPRWRAHLLSASVPYLLQSSVRDTEILDTARRALRKVGL